MGAVKVLDVTLRDGGCVNNFNFGQVYMDKILDAQERSGVDFIELGYLDAKSGTPAGRTQWDTAESISTNLLLRKKPGVEYLAMLDYGKFDVDTLPVRSPTTIDGIRLAFHKKDIHCIESVGRTILNKGYRLFVQPMITLRYSEAELLELITIVNDKLPEAYAFYIVDSFGEMRQNDVARFISEVDRSLAPSVALGFHSHNNLQLSYSNACVMLQSSLERPIILDCSIMGMGKGAGNLNTELLVGHLNVFYGKHYNVSPLLEVMDTVLNQIRAEYYWGYAPEYFLSSANRCTPSYASFFYNRHQLPIDQVGELLGMIAEDKKISFDMEYAEQLWRDYNENKSVDDSGVVNEISTVISGKKVLVVAPGRSISENKAVIDALVSRDDVVSIGLNITDSFPVDYLAATRQDVLQVALSQGKTVITTTNVSKGTRGDVRILNYSNWIDIRDGRTYDSSAVIVLNLLRSCGVKELLLAGLDGFSANINENYSDPNLRRPVSIEMAQKRNDYYKGFIAEIAASGIGVTFVTPSLYK